MTQQARIDIKVEEEAEAAATEAESAPEPIDLLLAMNATIIELTADEDNTDLQMDGTVADHWEDVDVEAA